ncbi:hypothetical protein MRB53_009835 [Persea americana]|uniref:Uncharacterized protein n=1 Tax=Persea americana TaxID=3435 RepID=A0ACC2LQV4_PERAE|nr:hypothetical protein MRB53_009835 [Persea americana]
MVEVEEAGRYPLGGTELGQGEDPEAEPMSTQDSKLPIHHLAGEESLVGERGRGVGLKWLELLDSNNFQSEDGDIIDCVDIYKQPALDNPLLKNHTIQMIPNYVEGKTKESSSQFLQAQQLWKKSGTCPEGTVPIRRMLERDLLRSIPAQYPMEYHKKDPRSLVEFAYASIDWDWNKDQGPYESASASISVWNVHVAPNELSVSTVILMNHDDNIAAGWKISEQQYRDNRTRLSIYWTHDGAQKTGCFNLDCPAFVQIDKNIVLGGTISPVSEYNSLQYYSDIELHQDKNAGDKWWLLYNGKVVGYWPWALFPDFRAATHVEWSGQILNTAAGGRHTNTPMGSGHFAQEGQGKAAVFSKMLVKDTKHTNWAPTWAKAEATKSACYNIEDVQKSNPDPGAYFFYGGPGIGPGCG